MRGFKEPKEYISMTPNDIYKSLAEIRDTFPKPSKVFVFLIEPAGKTGAFEGATQRAAVISMKSAWQLEGKEPTRRFAPTDESVIDYVRSIADNASQSPVQMLVVIDLSEGLTSVWVMPKSKCFIATAAYGSPLAPEVVTLRQFRDDVLVRSRLGRTFVSCYYFASPPLASFISKHEYLRALTRRCLLQPILHLIKKE
jgi:hypothetical protein